MTASTDTKVSHNGVGKVGKVPIDDPKKENYWLGWKATMIFGLLIIAGHAWFLFFLESEYKEKYHSNPHLNRIRDYVTLWVPIFLGTIALETIYFWITAPKSDVYRLNDSLGSLTLGSFNQLFKKLISQIIFIHGPYYYIWTNYGQYVVEQVPLLQNYWLAWWAMFLSVEFCYYWVHRTGHTIHAFWAMHGVHHSSEAYNLTTALRQSSLHFTVSWAYYVPLAFFFPPPLYFIHDQFNLLYQYWIHTQVIGKLGPLEYILNTPSQHRVHHGRNPYCIDKNYGGTLCVFDRLFGTFQEEIEEVPVVYGLTHSLNTFEPLKANAKPWMAIFSNMKSVKGLKNKFLCLWNGPGWIPGSSPFQEYEIPPCTRASVRKYHTELSGMWRIYLVFLFLYATAGTQAAAVGLSVSEGPNYYYSVIGMLYFGLTLFCIGLTCDIDSWTIPVQLLHAILGEIFFVYGILYIQEDFEWKTAEIVLVSAVCLLTILFVLFNRKDMDKSRVHPGMDYEFTKASEQAQWALLAQKKKAE